MVRLSIAVSSVCPIICCFAVLKGVWNRSSPLRIEALGSALALMNGLMKDSATSAAVAAQKLQIFASCLPSPIPFSRNVLTYQLNVKVGHIFINISIFTLYTLQHQPLVSS